MARGPWGSSSTIPAERPRARVRISNRTSRCGAQYREAGRRARGRAARTFRRDVGLATAVASIDHVRIRATGGSRARRRAARRLPGLGSSGGARSDFQWARLIVGDGRWGRISRGGWRIAPPPRRARRPGGGAPDFQASGKDYFQLLTLTPEAAARRDRLPSRSFPLTRTDSREGWRPRPRVQAQTSQDNWPGHGLRSPARAVEHAIAISWTGAAASRCPVAARRHPPRFRSGAFELLERRPDSRRRAPRRGRERADRGGRGGRVLSLP